MLLLGRGWNAVREDASVKRSSATSQREGCFHSQHAALDQRS